MNLLAVDPGIRGCGIAGFVNGVLGGAAYVASPQQHGALDVAACLAMACAVEKWCVMLIHEIAFEWPQVYTPGKQKGDPNDLPPLVGVDCAIAARYPNAKHITYLPAQWKGQVPKEANGENIIQHRVEARLSEQERMLIWLPTAKGLQHNVWDAIGIGLHHLGRFERFRVFAR